MLANEQLKQARLAKNFTEAQVAQHLNLPVSVIRLLEQGEYAALHGDAFVIAYIRGYAQFVGLHAEDLVQTYKQLETQKVGLQSSLVNNSCVKLQHKKYRTVYGLVASLAVFIVLAALTPSTFIPENSQQHSAIIVDTSVGTTQIAHLDNLPNDEPTLALMPELQVIPQYQERGNTVAVAQISQLKFRFSADCWVEVVDGDNQSIFSSIQRANQELQLSGKPPFKITLGYAPGVELSYNGESVDIDASSTIARFTLGKS